MNNLTAKSKITEGSKVYTGRNWKQKWSRKEWIVQNGIALPLFKHNFWCSVRGDVEDISREQGKKITLGKCKNTGSDCWQIEGEGNVFFSLFA